LETRVETQAVRIVTVARPADLACTADGTGALLTWTEPQGYDGIVVKRDGAVLAQIAAGVSTFRDEGTIVGGTYAYEVVGMVGLQRSPSARCTLSIPLPSPADVSCAIMGDRIRISWVARDTYDAVTVARGGQVIAIAAGDTLSVVDAPPPTVDPVSIEYVLVARKGERTSQPAFCQTRFASPRFIRGDTEGNGGVNIADAIRLLGHLFTAPVLGCVDSGDVDDNGALDLGDAIGILNYLFASGRPPAAPFPDPGIDLTSDTLTCAEGL